MSCGACGEGKSNNTRGEGEEEEEEENNNTLNDYITGFRVLVLQHTRPFDAAISRGRPSVRPSGKGRLEFESIPYGEHLIRKLKLQLCIPRLFRHFSAFFDRKPIYSVAAPISSLSPYADYGTWSRKKRIRNEGMAMPIITLISG